jgi:hypothetical protein
MVPPTFRVFPKKPDPVTWKPAMMFDISAVFSFLSILEVLPSKILLWPYVPFQRFVFKPLFLVENMPLLTCCLKQT